jgi:UPF0042 nucleotide-binding protein
LEFLIVTGLSGAGKTVALHSLEDIGFYCVDNIPPMLILTFYDLCQKSNDMSMKKIAIVTDIRGGETFETLFKVLSCLNKENKKYKILFLESRDDVLMKRFKTSRRRHPLFEFYKGSIIKSIQLERSLLSTVKERADYLIDTSFLSVAQLKKRISGLFLGDLSYSLNVNCMSFGFKYGLPTEADLVFDVRCLPNPYYVEELKNLTGLDQNVRDYVLKWDRTDGLVQLIFSFIDYTLPLYRDEGKSQLVVAIGCTGGRHRSVAIAQVLYEHLLQNKNPANVSHRDVGR